MLFKAWPKTQRFYKQTMWITEKIDGTNGAIIILADSALDGNYSEMSRVGTYLEEPDVWVAAQSRNRLITTSDDNAGFATWVHNNAEVLAQTLGPGYHYGEWWGQGIQRNYGLDHKRFSLFNAHRWNYLEEHSPLETLDVVPTLYKGAFSSQCVKTTLQNLFNYGSYAAPFDKPEGIIVHLSGTNVNFKVTDRDDKSKWEL